MNIELLKELSKQAETECGWSEEKFAELIVRECIQQMDNEYSKAWNNGVDASADKFVNGINKAMKVVKEHFGVE